MRGRAGSVPKISVFPTRISVSGLKIFAIEHFSLVTGMKAGWILQMNSASFWFACGIFHIISIQFNCSDTAMTVAKAMKGVKVITMCFAMFALFLEFHATTYLWLLSHLGIWAEISHFFQGEISPGKWVSPVNRAHVKKSLFYSQNLWDVDLKINWFVKMLLHGHQSVAHSGLWAPDGSPSTQFETWNFGCGLVHSWTHRE